MSHACHLENLLTLTESSDPIPASFAGTNIVLAVRLLRFCFSTDSPVMSEYARLPVGSHRTSMLFSSCSSARRLRRWWVSLLKTISFPASDSESDFIISGSHFTTTDDWHTEGLLRPVFMGCAMKNAKVITIALGSLQRLIALRAVSLSAIPAIIRTMNDCMSQGVDIQLKILQTLLSLITNFPAIHGRLLANVRAFVLCLCFIFSSLMDGPTGICCEIGPPSVFQAT